MIGSSPGPAIYRAVDVEGTLLEEADDGLVGSVVGGVCPATRDTLVEAPSASEQPCRALQLKQGR